MANGEGIKGRESVLAAARAKLEAQRLARESNSAPLSTQPEPSQPSQTPEPAPQVTDAESSVDASHLNPEDTKSVSNESAPDKAVDEVVTPAEPKNRSNQPPNPNSIRSRAFAGLRGALENYRKLTSSDNKKGSPSPSPFSRRPAEPARSERNMVRHENEGLQPIDTNEELEHKNRKRILWKMLGDLSQESLNGKVHAAEIIDAMTTIRQILDSGDRKSIDELYRKIMQTP